MVAKVEYLRDMRVCDCYAAYRGFAKKFGYISGRRLVCIISRTSLPASISEIEYVRSEKKPLHQVDMEVRMGKLFSPVTQRNHRNRVVSVREDTLSPTARVLIFLYGR